LPFLSTYQMEAYDAACKGWHTRIDRSGVREAASSILKVSEVSALQPARQYALQASIALGALGDGSEQSDLISDVAMAVTRGSSPEALRQSRGQHEGWVVGDTKAVLHAALRLLQSGEDLCSPKSFGRLLALEDDEGRDGSSGGGGGNSTIGPGTGEMTTRRKDLDLLRSAAG